MQPAIGWRSYLAVDLSISSSWGRDVLVVGNGAGLSSSIAYQRGGKSKDEAAREFVCSDGWSPVGSTRGNKAWGGANRQYPPWKPGARPRRKKWAEPRHSSVGSWIHVSASVEFFLRSCNPWPRPLIQCQRQVPWLRGGF